MSLLDESVFGNCALTGIDGFPILAPFGATFMSSSRTPASLPLTATFPGGSSVLVPFPAAGLAVNMRNGLSRSLSDEPASGEPALTAIDAPGFPVVVLSPNFLSNSSRSSSSSSDESRPDMLVFVVTGADGFEATFAGD
jgi:hypothetical protein